jgi:hypothetical protein
LRFKAHLMMKTRLGDGLGTDYLGTIIWDDLVATCLWVKFIQPVSCCPTVLLSNVGIYLRSRLGRGMSKMLLNALMDAPSSSNNVALVWRNPCSVT